MQPIVTFAWCGAKIGCGACSVCCQMFLSLACPRLISQLYLIFVPFCSARGVERIGGLHQPYTPRPSQAATKYRSSRPRAKQPPSITPQDHAPSYSQVFALRVRSLSTELAYRKASQRWSEWACSHTPSLSRPCRPQAPTSVYTSPSFSRQLVRPLRLIVFQRGLLVRTSKPDGYLQGSRSDHLRVSRSLIIRLESSLVSTRPSADKRPPCFPSRLRLSHQGTQTNLCVLCV